MIAWLFDQGHAADIILAVLAIEAAWLKSRGWTLASLLGLLGPAALIVIGLRGAMTDAHWLWIAVPLALSLPLHLFDLSQRR